MTMLIAGHETTAAVLTWAVFLLAQVCPTFVFYGDICSHSKCIYICGHSKCILNFSNAESLQNEKGSSRN